MASEGTDVRTGLVGEVRKHFRPEFFSRIDHVIPFRALSEQDILAVVDLELAKAAKRAGFVRRGLTLHVDAEAKARLAELGYHPTRGARPLRRVIEERVFAPLAVLMAADPKLADRRVQIVAEGSEAQRRLAGSGSLMMTL